MHTPDYLNKQLTEKDRTDIYVFWRTMICHDTLYVSMYIPCCNQECIY